MDKKKTDDKKTKDVNPVAKGAQATPEYKEDAVVLTDNRNTDINQPHLNENSEAIKRSPNIPLEENEEGKKGDPAWDTNATGEKGKK